MSDSHPRFLPNRLTRRWGSLLLSGCFVIAFVGLLSTWNGRTFVLNASSSLQSQALGVRGGVTRTPTGVVLDKGHYLKGPPTNSFKENLKPEFDYVTTWHYAGITNDFIVMCNLIYLGLITRRIPILPPFAPAATHLRDAKPVPFGEIFDLKALSEAIQWPILDWADVKKARYNESFHYGDAPLAEVERDQLGCWSNWAGLDGGHRASHSITTEFLALDIVYTAVPQWARLTKFDWDYHASFSGIASLLSLPGRTDALDGSEPLLTMTFEEKMKDVSMDPDEHLACFDLLYYVGVKDAWEWSGQHIPVWDLVATHAKFLPSVDAVAEETLRKVFGVQGDDIPKYISIHVRRTDFASNCSPTEAQDCFAPLAMYARRVNQVREELKVKKGLDVTEVVLTSDEVDPAWWAEVRDLGWRYVDHDKEETSEKYGSWFPAIIDKIIQSRGIGFVGTDKSTMSIVAERRVKDWHRGVTRTVVPSQPDMD